MNVLMLGWEYPPHISGGLGTACEGLTKALARLGVGIEFVVPTLYGGEDASHMGITDASRGYRVGGKGASTKELTRSIRSSVSVGTEERGIKTTRIPSFLTPYSTESSFNDLMQEVLKGSVSISESLRNEIYTAVEANGGYDVPGSAASSRYSGDLFGEVSRYAARVLSLADNFNFDIIHAHDWMTFPAAVALSELTGKPLVTHVHSIEFDRSGEGANPRIESVERMGVQRATRVVAVSYYTRGKIVDRYGVSKDKISVVHNGVYPKELLKRYREERMTSQSRIVLFLGRITFQKGPDYFVEAAAKVVPYVPDVLFVMAGSGDMLPRMMHRVEELGLSKNFLFTGFLKGREVEEMFSIADLYVMPSVSEPFGITALEAINFEAPVVISKQSGVSEVLRHALKADFWDVDRMADLIINALLHEELRSDIVSMAREEVRRLRWDASAQKSIAIYNELLGR